MPKQDDFNQVTYRVANIHELAKQFSTPLEKLPGLARLLQDLSAAIARVLKEEFSADVELGAPVVRRENACADNVKNYILKVVDSQDQEDASVLFPAKLLSYVFRRGCGELLDVCEYEMGPDLSAVEHLALKALGVRLSEQFGSFAHPLIGSHREVAFHYDGDDVLEARDGYVMIALPVRQPLSCPEVVLSLPKGFLGRAWGSLRQGDVSSSRYEQFSLLDRADEISANFNVTLRVENFTLANLKSAVAQAPIPVMPMKELQVFLESGEHIVARGTIVENDGVFSLLI